MFFYQFLTSFCFFFQKIELLLFSIKFLSIVWTFTIKNSTFFSFLLSNFLLFFFSSDKIPTFFWFCSFVLFLSIYQLYLFFSVYISTFFCFTTKNYDFLFVFFCHIVDFHLFFLLSLSTIFGCSIKISTYFDFSIKVGWEQVFSTASDDNTSSKVSLIFVI